MVMLIARLRIRIEWCHCDPAKIIYNPHYYIWMDQCTHALLRLGGMDLKNHIDDPSFKGCPLVTSTAEFHSPAFLGDKLSLNSQVSRFGNKSFDVEHKFFRDDELICTGKEIRVWGATNSEGTLIAIPVPPWIKNNLNADGCKDVSV